MKKWIVCSLNPISSWKFSMLCNFWVWRRLHCIRPVLKTRVRMDKSAQGTQYNTQFSQYDDNQTKPWKYVYVQLVHVYLEPVWAEYRKKTGGTRVFCQTELEPVSLWLEEVDINPLESSTASWSLQTLEFIMYVSIP